MCTSPQLVLAIPDGLENRCCDAVITLWFLDGEDSREFLFFQGRNIQDYHNRQNLLETLRLQVGHVHQKTQIRGLGRGAMVWLSMGGTLLTQLNVMMWGNPAPEESKPLAFLSLDEEMGKRLVQFGQYSLQILPEVEGKRGHHVAFGWDENGYWFLDPSIGYYEPDSKECLITFVCERLGNFFSPIATIIITRIPKQN